MKDKLIKGFACGVFDLFHPGHVIMLRDCKKHCTFLSIGLNRASHFDVNINPGKKIPIYSFEQRKLLLESSKYVDQVIGYESEEELVAIMKNGKFDVRFLGDDYKGKPITGADAISNITYLDRSHGLSSTYFKQKILDSLK